MPNQPYNLPTPSGMVWDTQLGQFKPAPVSSAASTGALTTTNTSHTSTDPWGNPTTTNTSTVPNVASPDTAATTAAQIAIAQGNNATTAHGQDLAAGTAHEQTLAQQMIAQGANATQLAEAGISAQTAAAALASQSAYQQGQLGLATQAENFTENQATIKQQALAPVLAALTAGATGSSGGIKLPSYPGSTLALAGDAGSGGVADANALTPAEQAQMTTAKENSGLRLRASLQALKSLDAQRGIEGSSIEQSGISNLIGTEAGSQNAEEGSLMNAHSANALHVNDEEYQAAVQAAMAAPGQANAQLQALLQAYGMAY